MHICPLCNGTGQVEGSIASRLTEARKAKHLTQLQASEHLPVSRAQLANIEMGKSNVQPEFLIKAAKLYGITTDYILGVGEE